MKAVMVMFDTLSRSFLPNYGNEWVIAPNFERLEDHAVRFDQFYAGSLPCMPARREIQTGRFNFLHRGWGPLEPFDFSVFEEMQQHSIYSHLVTDHSHYFEDGGATYHNRYSSWDGFRGQEGDRWMPRLGVGALTEQNPLNKTGISVQQNAANRTVQQQEEELPTVRTIAAGVSFLEQFHNQDNWYLQIECFDPHEPFQAPEQYRQLYECQKDGSSVTWPVYQRVPDGMEADAMQNMQKEYAAAVSMCDNCLGKVLDAFDRYDLWKDTLLIVNTDHGFMLGEHGYMGKNITPLYDQLVHLPFFIHVPGEAGQHNGCQALAQTVDIPATLLDYFGIENIGDMDGKSLLKVLANPQTPNHEVALFGVNGGHTGIYDGQFVYMRASAHKDNGPLVNYTLMPTQMRGFFAADSLEQMELVEGNRFTRGLPCLKMPIVNLYPSYETGDLLFDMDADPEQCENVLDEEIRQRLAERLADMLRFLEAPTEEFVRLGIRK